MQSFKVHSTKSWNSIVSQYIQRLTLQFKGWNYLMNITAQSRILCEYKLRNDPIKWYIISVNTN